MGDNNSMKRFADLWYGLLLVVSGVLMAWYCFHVHPAEPAKALAKAKRTFDAELRAFHDRTDSLYRTFTDPRSTIDAARAEELFNLPFAVLAYRGDSLVYWSHNTLLPSLDAIRSAQGYSLQRWKNGFYLLRNIELHGTDALQQPIRYAFIKPVKYDYATTNEYLRPGFASEFDVDQHIDLSTNPSINGAIVDLPDGNAFYISFNPASSDSQTVFRLYLFFLIACLMIVAGVYTLVQPALRAMPFTSRLLIHGAFIYALHFVFHLVNPVPKRFLEWDIFNPNYYASPFVAGSLGTLFIELVLICYASVRWYLSATERPANEPPRWYFTLLQSAVVVATAADEEGRLAVLPALEDVGTARFLAHGVQALALHEPLELGVLRAHGRARADPLGLPLDGRLRVACLDAQHAAPLGCDRHASHISRRAGACTVRGARRASH